MVTAASQMPGYMSHLAQQGSHLQSSNDARWWMFINSRTCRKKKEGAVPRDIRPARRPEPN
jgi:hypothetical protein